MQKGLPVINVGTLLRHDPSLEVFIENGVEKLMKRGLPAIPNVLFQGDPLLGRFLSTSKPKGTQAPQAPSATIFEPRDTGLRVKLKIHPFSGQGKDSPPMDVPDTGGSDRSPEAKPAEPKDSPIVAATEDTEDTSVPVPIGESALEDACNDISLPEADDTAMASDEDLTLCEDAEATKNAALDEDVVGPLVCTPTDEDSYVFDEAKPQINETITFTEQVCEATLAEERNIFEVSDVGAVGACDLTSVEACSCDNEDMDAVATSDDLEDGPVTVEIVDFAAEDSSEKFISVSVSEADDTAVASGEDVTLFEDNEALIILEVNEDSSSVDIPAPVDGAYCAPTEDEEAKPYVGEPSTCVEGFCKACNKCHQWLMPSSIGAEGPLFTPWPSVPIAKPAYPDVWRTSPLADDPVLWSGISGLPSTPSQPVQDTDDHSDFPISQPDVWRTSPLADDPFLWGTISGQLNVSSNDEHGLDPEEPLSGLEFDESYNYPLGLTIALHAVAMAAMAAGSSPPSSPSPPSDDELAMKSKPKRKRGTRRRR
ncbi:hypothetical protein HGRIS_014095 [Hohenbuehelia grisea]|uniref:Uncharacterized protein n=1 Tax=Hohenbuehelia grisea TaxID=104357 RepID=A0ABR3JSI2_9AGAR